MLNVIYGAPKYLISDNGTEFKNNILKKFCLENNIKFLQRLPYRPYSQGVVERLHRIIKRGLYIHKEEMKNNYNIDFSLSEIIKIKNNSYSKIIGCTPNDIFFKDLNEEEIKNINDKM